mmetsp:Transcript_53691/g.122580  ORF Transcript_53691/g.122580 Transcript_53691/m.122580 type:complete len:245 (+) Transcript_53691:1299-2033(+)
MQTAGGRVFIPFRGIRRVISAVRPAISAGMVCTALFDKSSSVMLFSAIASRGNDERPRLSTRRRRRFMAPSTRRRYSTTAAGPLSWVPLGGRMQPLRRTSSRASAVSLPSPTGRSSILLSARSSSRSAPMSPMLSGTAMMRLSLRRSLWRDCICLIVSGTRVILFDPSLNTLRSESFKIGSGIVVISFPSKESSTRVVSFPNASLMCFNLLWLARTVRMDLSSAMSSTKSSSQLFATESSPRRV